MIPDLEYSRLLAQIRKHEGLRLKPYRCSAGKLTIGYGRNLDDVGISRSEAEILLGADVGRALDGVGRIIPGLEDTLDPIRVRVLADMVLNIGEGSLRRFPRFLAAIKRGDFEAAADEMVDSLWYRQVGTRAVRLVAMMRTGLDYRD